MNDIEQEIRDAVAAAQRVERSARDCVTFMGLVVPTEQKGRNLRDGLCDVLASTATVGLDDGEGALVNINHDPRRQFRVWDGVSLYMRPAALYARIDLPRCHPLTDEILANRALWRGLSMEHLREDEISTQSRATGVRRITTLGTLIGIAFVMGKHRPSWAATWFTDDVDAALDRMGREHELALGLAVA